MKISIIGAGNVGSQTAMHLIKEGFNEIILVDIVEGDVRAKAFDLEDAKSILKFNYDIYATVDIKKIKESDIVIITAGLTRKPGMSREDLLNKNAQIVKEISLNIKRITPQSIIIVVTNPLDLMTYLVLKITDFKPNKVFGMGVSLDASRFANLISKELNIPVTDIEATVIGSHGQGMIPLVRFTNIRGIALDEFLDNEKLKTLIKKTMERGAEIISLLEGKGSAYFAPSLAVTEIVKVVAKDEKRTLGVSAYLNGEYAVKDICIGVPCRLGREGIEKIIELNLNEQEKDAFLRSVIYLREQYNNITI